MFIAISKSAPGQPCTVRLDDYLVPFGSRAQAEAFVRVLRKRIAAPHVLPPVPLSRQPSAHAPVRGKVLAKRMAVGAH